MEQKRMNVTGLLTSAGCGVLSLLMVFVVVPKFLRCPDLVWMAIDILAPVALALLLLGALWRFPPVYVWVGLPVQYLILFLFRAPIAKISGLSLAGLGGFEYFFAAAVWPPVVTLAQFLALLLLEKRKKR